LICRANAFKTLFYTRLAPKFVLEVEREKLLKKVFDHREGLWPHHIIILNQIIRSRRR